MNIEKRTLSFFRSFSGFLTFFVVLSLTCQPRLLATVSQDIIDSSASGSGVSSESGYNVVDQTTTGSGQESVSPSHHLTAASSGEASTLRQLPSASLVMSFCQDPHKPEWKEEIDFTAMPRSGGEMEMCPALCDFLRSSNFTYPFFPNSTWTRSLSSLRETMDFLLRFKKWSRLWQGNSTSTLTSMTNTSKILGYWGFVVDEAQRLVMILESCNFNSTYACAGTLERGPCREYWKTSPSPAIASVTAQNSTNVGIKSSPAPADFQYLSANSSDDLDILMSIGNLISRLVDNHRSTHNATLMCDFGLFSLRVVNLLRFIEDVIQLAVLRDRFKAWQSEKPTCHNQSINVSRSSARNHTLDLRGSLVQDLLTGTFCNPFESYEPIWVHAH